MKFILVTISFFLTIHLIKANDSGYNLEDLEVLAKENNFEEFLNHAFEVKPRERKGQWTQLFVKMCAQKIEASLKTRTLSLAFFNDLLKYNQLLEINKNLKFQFYKNQYALEFLKFCQDKKNLIPENTCKEKIIEYWNSSEKGTDEGIEIAKLLINFESTPNLWDFISKSTTHKISEVYCKIPIVQKVLLDKLIEVSFQSDFDNNFLELKKKLMNQSCYDQIKASFKNMFFLKETNILAKELIFNLLDSQKDLTQIEQYLFSILFLVDSPVVGERMNFSWNKVASLLENLPLRLKLMSEIENLSQLSDNVFKTPKMPRQKAIINHLAKNFPEFLKFYAENCLSYLKMDKSDKIIVSSSINCHEFFLSYQKEKKNLSTSWISDSISKQYSALKK